MMDDDNWQVIDRPEEGEAVCFDLQAEMRLFDGAVVNVSEQGFVVCFQGELRAWRNHCPHAGSPLDWIPGQFFDADGQLLVCHTHHAEFEPLSGECIAGPCPRGLYALPIKELNKAIAVPLRIVL
ncbi:MAG: Rieske 2Fe-2S domain-containing protein [Mariprofundus sp.]|nr:Rieske 2Fe-2S domain-containing protein [Mariprofundus sp.]